MDAEQSKTKKCADHFFLDPQDKLLSTYDTYMVVVIAFSCFSSAYYAAFDFPYESIEMLILEHIVFASFTLEIILKCMRLESNDASERSHSKIIKRYVKSPQFYVDFLATFPFYLFMNDPNETSSTYAVVFKLLRMIRLPKIVSLLDETRFDKLNEWIVSG